MSEIDLLMADIRMRLNYMPVQVGSGDAVPALPAPETLDWSVDMYGSFWAFMDAVNIQARLARMQPG